MSQDQSPNARSQRALAIRNLRVEIANNPDDAGRLIHTQLWVARHFGDAALEAMTLALGGPPMRDLHLHNHLPHTVDSASQAPQEAVESPAGSTVAGNQEASLEERLDAAQETEARAATALWSFEQLHTRKLAKQIQALEEALKLVLEERDALAAKIAGMEESLVDT